MTMRQISVILTSRGFFGVTARVFQYNAAGIVRGRNLLKRCYCQSYTEAEKEVKALLSDKVKHIKFLYR
jgi:hypothetical protein